MLRLDEAKLDWICEQIPDHVKSPRGGRPPAEKRRIVEGVFRRLDNGAKWKDLPARFGSKSTVRRWFKRQAGADVFENLLAEAGELIESKKGFKLYECFIDGTFSKAKGGGGGIGCTKAGRGVKIMVIVDAHGLPVAARSGDAGPHESTLAQGLLDFMIADVLPERLIGDKANDSDKLDRQLACRGVDMIAPPRNNRLPENITQDGRKLRRYRRRWTVERTIAWIQHFRRLCIRQEKSTATFQGYLSFASSLILLNRVLG